MTLQAIVKALGGDLYAGGLRANIPGPGHSRADRSVSLLLDRGRLVVHCFGRDDWRLVLNDLRARRLIDADNRPTGLCTPGADRAPILSTRLERLEAVQRIWALGRPIKGSLADRYARLRAIGRELPGPDVARFIPQAPTSVYTPSSPVHAALALAIRAADGDLAGLELTYLAPNGQRSIRLRLSRKTIGAAPVSSAVRIDKASGCLLVGEGFLTTLSATERFGLPGWALLSTRNLRAWSPPSAVRRVLIAADRGEDGERSAGRLKSRLEAAGLAASIEWPPEPFGDWNDWAMGR